MTGLEIQGVPLTVAVRKDPAAGRRHQVFDDSAICTTSAGSAESCAIDSGKRRSSAGCCCAARRSSSRSTVPLPRRRRPGRRLHAAGEGQDPDPGAVLPRGRRRTGARPAAERVAEHARADRHRRHRLAGRGARAADHVAAKTFDFSLTGDQTSQRGFIVLDPPTDPSASSGSSGSSGSSSGSSGSSRLLGLVVGLLARRRARQRPDDDARLRRLGRGPGARSAGRLAGAVRLGPRLVAAALEDGHPRVAREGRVRPASAGTARTPSRACCGRSAGARTLSHRPNATRSVSRRGGRARDCAGPDG